MPPYRPPSSDADLSPLEVDSDASDSELPSSPARLPTMKRGSKFSTSLQTLREQSIFDPETDGDSKSRSTIFDTIIKSVQNGISIPAAKHETNSGLRKRSIKSKPTVSKGKQARQVELVQVCYWNHLNKSLITRNLFLQESVSRFAQVFILPNGVSRVEVCGHIP